MNICDNPNRVSVYQEWRESDTIQRVPIIVTGNDLSHMFAPLVRDGRMTKYYWKPDREDLSHILFQMYKVDLKQAVLSVTELIEQRMQHVKSLATRHTDTWPSFG